MKEQGDRLAVRLKEGLFTLCTRYPESLARATLVYALLQVPAFLAVGMWLQRWNLGLSARSMGLLLLCYGAPFLFLCMIVAVIKLSEKKHLYWVIVVMKLVMIPASIVVSVEAVPHVARIPGDHIDGWNVLIGSISWALAAAFISATVGVKKHRSAAA